MAEITPRLVEILRMYLSDEELKAACYQHPKSKRWLISHWPLMTLRVRANIILDEPLHILRHREPEDVILLQRGRVSHNGALHEAWAYGTATQKNCVIEYRYPIARKRGEDIVVLELLGRMHNYAMRGALASEDEVDEWKDDTAELKQSKASATAEPVRIKTERVREKEAIKAELDKEVEEGLMSRMEPPGPMDEWRARILECKTRAELQALYEDELLPNVERFTKEENQMLNAMFALHGKSLK